MSKNEIPVISLADAHSYETMGLIDFACREWGFFQIVDHGIDEALIHSVQDRMREFFELDREEKCRIERTESNPWGFYDRELTKNVRDWKEIYDFGPAFKSEAGSIVEPQWPEAPEGFQSVVEDYYRASENLAKRILDIIAVNLGVEPAMLASGFDSGHTSFLRMNYYPVCPDPETPEGEFEPQSGHLALNRHTDAGAITLLQQDDQAGLQVFSRDQWITVEPIRGAITVNIGDIVQVWSNDEYKAALHRVLANPAAVRFSIPFFYNPSYNYNYGPLPTVVNDQAPARYREINWGEFRSLRAAGDYADQGDEVQISHYRTEEVIDGVY